MKISLLGPAIDQQGDIKVNKSSDLSDCVTNLKAGQVEQALRGSECRYKQNSKPKMHVETREVGESLVAPASPLSTMLCICHVSKVCL